MLLLFTIIILFYPRAKPINRIADSAGALVIEKKVKMDDNAPMEKIEFCGPSVGNHCFRTSDSHSKGITYSYASNNIIYVYSLKTFAVSPNL